MIGDLSRRLTELRFLDGIQKVEHVPYSTGDEFWVRFSKPLDFKKISGIAAQHGCLVVRFANLPSKLPMRLAEMVWNGVTHVITKKISGWSRFTSSLGFEPDGIAKIASDLHGPYEIFIATQEEGIQLLYEYLDQRYVPPPPPPPKPVAPAKPTAPVSKPPAPASPPKPPATSPVVSQPVAQKPTVQASAQASVKPVSTATSPSSTKPSAQQPVELSKNQKADTTPQPSAVSKPVPDQPSQKKEEK